MTTIESAREYVAERVNPAVESVKGNVRDARRAMTHGQHAVEDFAASTALQVRRRPLAAVALAALSGVLTGCMFGFVLGYRLRPRPGRD